MNRLARGLQRIATDADGKPNVLGKSVILMIQRGMAVVDAGANLLARGAIRGVSLVELDVLAQTLPDGGTSLLLRYHLAANQSAKAGPLIFDARQCPLLISSARTGPRSDVEHRTWDVSPPSFSVEARRGSWDGEIVEVSAVWPATDPAPCLALPGSVPIPILSRERGLRPTVRLSPPVPGKLTVVGLSRETSRFRDGADLVEAGLLRTSSSVDQTVVLSDELAQRLGAGAAGFREEVEAALEYLGSVFGVPARAKTAWGVMDEAWLKGTRSGCFPLKNPHGSALMFGFAVSGVWWGGGYRIYGRHWKLLESALRLFSSLLWIEGRDAGELESALESVVDFTDRGLGESISTIVLGGLDPVRLGRATVALYDAYASDPSTAAVLGGAAQASWGKEVHETEVLSWLAEGGIDLRGF